MRSSEIENACMVVRTPVARAAPGDRSHTRYRGSAARGPHLAFPRPLRLGTIFARCPVAVLVLVRLARAKTYINLIMRFNVI